MSRRILMPVATALKAPEEVAPKAPRLTVVRPLSTIAEHVKSLQAENKRLRRQLKASTRALQGLFISTLGAPPFSREQNEAFRVLRKLKEL